MYKYTFISPNGVETVVFGNGIADAAKNARMEVKKITRLSNEYLQDTPFNKRVYTVYIGDEYTPYKVLQKKAKPIDQIIKPINSRYGAPMGRTNIGNRPANKTIFDCYVPMSSCGAYDKGGAYWGIGARLRVSYSKDLSYIHFYREL